MTSPLIYDDQNSDGCPATSEELAAILDGTSILDIWRDTRDQD